MIFVRRVEIMIQSEMKLNQIVDNERKSVNPSHEEV